MLRKHLTFLVLFFLFLLALMSTGHVQASDSVIVGGQVVESFTGQPIENATVAFWNQSGLVSSVRTDNEGRYETTVKNGSYTVYAYFDDPSTPGFDYAPSIKRLYMRGQMVNTTFTLVDGSSIMVEGEIRSVFWGIPEEYNFRVMDPLSEIPLKIDEYTFVYGTSTSSHNSFLGLDPNHVIVPAGMNVNVEVLARFSGKYYPLERALATLGHFNLSKGQMLRMDVEKKLLLYDLNRIKSYNTTGVQPVISSIETRLNEMEQMGFYTVTERREFSRINWLVEDSRLKLNQSLYDESLANLREARVSAQTLNEGLLNMYNDAKTSAVILVFFLALTATALGHLFFESKYGKLIVTCVIYSVLVLVLYTVYPGCQLVPTTPFLIIVVGSISGVLSAPYLLPFLAKIAKWYTSHARYYGDFNGDFVKKRAVKRGISFSGAVVEFFSIAKRNLKRRRLRSVLTFITVTVLVMSFVALTSFQGGYGLVVKPQPLITPISDGLIVKHPPDPMEVDSPFISFAVSDVEWLLGKPNASLVAPKVENYPSFNPVGVSGTLRFNGWLGILPSVEAQITHINETVVEGRYLQDEDQFAVLISVEVMRAMNLMIGDKLWLQSGSYSTYAELVGAFDGQRLAQIRDLDGRRIMPQKLVGNEETVLAYCDPSEVIITHWETALRFNVVHISRLGVVPSSLEASPVLARQVVLERELLVWFSLGGQVSLTSLGSTFEWKGFTLLVPWGIVILNVVVSMLNALHIRRREISILSAVGLNPSHVTWLYLTEAGIIGFMGGGVGYLLGLGLYPVMSFLSAGVEVYQKVSVVWCLAALGIAVTAVLIGGVAALKSTTVVTPSLIRRWRLKTEKPSLRGLLKWLTRKPEEPRTIDLPVKVPRGDIDSFMAYLERSLKIYEKFPQGPHFERVIRVDEDVTKRILFIYVGEVLAWTTSNEIVATKESGVDAYSIRLVSRFGGDNGVQETANTIRRIIMEWSVEGIGGLTVPTPFEIGQEGERIVAQWLRDNDFTIDSWDTQSPGSTYIEAHTSQRRFLVQVRSAIHPNKPSKISGVEERNIKSKATGIDAEAWEARVQLNTELRLFGDIMWRKLN